MINTHFTDKPIEPVTKISTAPKDYYADFDIFSKSAIFSIDKYKLMWYYSIC